MDWKRAIEEERAALGRIVALLFALAGLAERAAGRSPVVRAMVLWVLRHAEMIARDFVTGDSDALPASMPNAPAGGAAADAMRLAMRFRALARQLDAEARLLAAPRREDGGGIEPLPSGRSRSIRRALSALAALACRAAQPVRAPDTS